MPILFICSQETDYLQDLTYAGLAELLGKDQVVDFPYHWSYHKEKRFFWNKKNLYPKNLGFVLSSENESKFSFEEIKKSIQKNNFELVILASAKPDALKTLNDLFEWIKVPWIFIDGGDWTEVGGDFRRTGGESCFNLFLTLCAQKNPAAIFKREIPLGFKKNSLFSLPFSINTSIVPACLPSDVKDKQVLFWAVESSPTRKEVFRLLKGKYDCDQNGSVSEKTFRNYSLRGENYFRALNRTKIALSFRGEGFDTLRFWEIPTAGTLLLSEKPLIEIPNCFEDKKQAVFCKNDLSDMISLIDYYLTHENEAKGIAAEGQKHLLKFHTHIRRAEYILDILNTQLNLKFNR